MRSEELAAACVLLRCEVQPLTVSDDPRRSPPVTFKTEGWREGSEEAVTEAGKGSLWAGPGDSLTPWEQILLLSKSQL